MLKDIQSVKVLQEYQIQIQFEDGVGGVVDIAGLVPFKGIFAPLKKRSEFEKVRVNKELGVIEWECGADLDPDQLYALVTKQKIPDYSFAIDDDR